MHQASLLTTLGCSGSLAAALLFSQPALAASDLPHATVGSDNTVMTQDHTHPQGAATLSYTSDDSLSDAIGCACALCNTDRERTTTPPMW